MAVEPLTGPATMATSPTVTSVIEPATGAVGLAVPSAGRVGAPVWTSVSAVTAKVAV